MDKTVYIWTMHGWSDDSMKPPATYSRYLTYILLNDWFVREIRPGNLNDLWSDTSFRDGHVRGSFANVKKAAIGQCHKDEMFYQDCQLVEKLTTFTVRVGDIDFLSRDRQMLYDQIRKRRFDHHKGLLTRQFYRQRWPGF